MNRAMREVALLIRITTKCMPIAMTRQKAAQMAAPVPKAKIPMKRDAVVRGVVEDEAAVDAVVALKAKLKVDQASRARNVDRVPPRRAHAEKNRKMMRTRMIWDSTIRLVRWEMTKAMTRAMK
jgi:hypothetical protein